MAYIDPRTNKDGEIISYRIRVSKGYDAEGKRLKPYFMTWVPPKGLSKRQIQTELQRQAVLFEEKCKGGEVADCNMKLRDFIPEYIDTVSVTMSPTTLHFYQQVISNHILPKLGGKKLTDIKPIQIQQFIKYLTELKAQHKSPTNDSGKLSATTIRRYLCVLQSIFRLAVKLDIIAVNPADAGKLTLPKKVAPKIEIFTKAEAAEMLKCLQTEPLQFQTFIQLAIITGAR